MPRRARIHAESGIYHVMLRGINSQQIFEDEEDNIKFLNCLRKYKSECGFKLFAYCLMGNHVHLLMQEGAESLSQVFRRLGTGFVYWYNIKYQRTGHLFQDRFKSETVEDTRYFCTVVNYIHQNPVKAGICHRPEEYPYSSIHEFLGCPDLVDLDYLEQFVTIETVLDMQDENTTAECLEMTDPPSRRYITDQKAKQLIMETIGNDSVSAIQALTIIERDNCLRCLKRFGLSLRQISRLTGVSYYIVQKIK